MKYFLCPPYDVFLTSLPARGAWIEMPFFQRAPEAAVKSLPARGAWIEIFLHSRKNDPPESRSPHGERGLKYPAPLSPARLPKASLPARGAWIEIHGLCAAVGLAVWSLPARGAWIEIAVMVLSPHTK